MQQADKKEHIHGETGVGAEIHLLKRIYLDVLWWHMTSFTPNLKLEGFSGLGGFQVFSCFLPPQKGEGGGTQTRSHDKTMPKIISQIPTFRFLVRKLAFNKILF